jgi:hypothetical protein
MRLCAVVGGRPMKAARDDGPGWDGLVGVLGLMAGGGYFLCRNGAEMDRHRGQQVVVYSGRAGRW